LGIPIYLVLGNEDSTCGDYRITPDGPFLDTVAQSMQVFDNKPEAALSFRKARFYDLPHPIVPDEQLLLLNSVLWSTLYSNCKPDGTDLGQAELDWLTAKLQDAKALNKKVILVMHIPPGIDAHASFSDNSSTSVTNFWKGHYTEQFITLMQRYGGVVQIALAGHTHMDDFRVLAASTNGQSVPLHITPAVSSIFGNNPAFSVLRYDVITVRSWILTAIS
jgi:sphingomyelin phosphodiesterase acid-like 3